MLVSWLGRTDLNASKDNAQVGLGPLAQAVQQRCFDRLILLNNYPKPEADAYLHWIESLFPSLKFDVQHISLSGPTNYDEIYRSVIPFLDKIKKTHPQTTFTFHLSPGTPAMAAVWIILAKTYFPAELIESSREHGVKTVNFPFDLSAEFLPDSLKVRDARLADLSASLPPKAPAFEDIVYRCESMDRLILKARKVSLRSVPVLIEGESGTGKELLARAIHKAGPRCKKPFIAVNCGAIPFELVESELFGHAKGAFTGAEKSRTGYFEAAQTGTLFLDEIGELPLSAQVKVLRSLQENEVLRVGTTQPISLDIRVIAATNRDLIREVQQEHFRADLFYRLAVAVLKLPALRHRPGDLSLLIDSLLQQVNTESRSEPGYQEKKITPSAKNILLQHTWPGNVRELLNTLRRAAIWSDGSSITPEDVQEALLPALQSNSSSDILNHSLENPIDLPNIMGHVAGHYILQALENTGGNKTKAAQLLGLKSYRIYN